MKLNKDSWILSVDNSTALRAIFCIIVMLVHVPEGRQNFIQDLIGSFAYIGVTFFFMTSGYGLTLSFHKNNHVDGAFWIKRIKSILIPQIIVNILVFFSYLVIFSELKTKVLYHIDAWLLTLSVCYILFFLVYRFCPEKYRIIILVIAVIAVSIIKYLINSNWHTEMIGFVYGVLLYYYQDRIKKYESSFVSLIISMFMSLIRCDIY